MSTITKSTTNNQTKQNKTKTKHPPQKKTPTKNKTKQNKKRNYKNIRKKNPRLTLALLSPLHKRMPFSFWDHMKVIIYMFAATKTSRYYFDVTRILSIIMIVLSSNAHSLIFFRINCKKPNNIFRAIIVTGKTLRSLEIRALRFHGD